MKKLYQPIRINQLELRNRAVLAPMGIGNTKDGYSTERDVAFYRTRAKGGVGLIVYANIQFDPIRYNPKSGALLTEERFVPGLKRVTDAVHAEGAKMFAQLMHKGRYATAATHMNVQSVAPSAIPSRFTGFEMPREMSIEEIHQFVEWQAYSATLAMQAGFDGIEIETNSGYLFGQFFSPLVNKRTDEYGGSLENRTRFLVETLAAVRAAIGPTIPICVRIGGNDFVPGSCTNDDICDICELLDNTGNVDVLSVTGGWHEASVPLITMELPHATYAYLGRAIKKRVNCLVMQSNRMNIPTAEALVERGDIDLALFGRPILAEPNLINLAQAGRVDEIRPCIGCNAGCLDVGIKGKPTGCIGNPECNIEGDLMDALGRLPCEVKSEHPERILVIGAGPAGMEFARVAASRGNQVCIWEARGHSGGQMQLAAAPPRRGDIALLAQWLERRCQSLGVEIVFNKKANAEDILAVAADYDRIVLATGAQPLVPPIPTEEGAQVVQAWDVLEGKADTGKRVAIVGGGAVGVETALYLAEIGTLSADQLRFMMIFDVEPYEKIKELLNRGSKDVHIIEMQKAFAKDINPGARWSILARVRQLGVQMHNLSTVTEIKRDGVCLQNAEGESFIPADTVVLAIGAKSNNGLYEQLLGRVDRLNILGDAAAVAKIPEAIRSAYRLAISF